MTERGARRLLAAVVLWSLATGAWLASADLTSRRFWDERFSVSNVERVLVDGTLRPENGWYGRLSYLPQTLVLAGVQALHRLTGSERLAVLQEPQGFAPAGYLVARLVSVVYGAGALVLAFLIGRRIFSLPVALLGTALLASCPWALRHFATFKPDALLLLLVLVAFYWSLGATERPSSQSFAVAGLGVGLAASAKFTGALAALPVVAAALVAGDRWRTALHRLVVAGAASIAVFLTAHPDLGFYLRFLRQQRRIYAGKGSHSFGSMLATEVSDLLHWSFHGPWVGAAALAGLAALGVWLLRLLPVASSDTRARHLALFVSFPVGFSLVYALATTWPKGNNYLVIVPFTSLAAAWLLHVLWTRLAERLPARARGPALVLALGALLLLTIWPASLRVYRQMLPTTLDRAVDRIRQMSPVLSVRRAVVESGTVPLQASSSSRHRHDVLVTREVAALSELPEADLDLVDFELFAEARLRGADAVFYRRRMERVDGAAVELLRPGWFATVGPARVLVMHPWSRLGQPLEIEWRRGAPGKGHRVGRLPRGLRAGQIVSLEARLPRRQRGLAGVRVGGLELPLAWNGWDEQGERFSSPRFALPAPSLRVRPSWAGGEDPRRPVRIVVVRWDRR